jgi:hypothetical protein
MTIQEIIDAIEERALEAQEDMRQAEADGETMFDLPYHEGRFEALDTTVEWLRAQFFAGSPSKH